MAPAIEAGATGTEGGAGAPAAGPLRAVPTPPPSAGGKAALGRAGPGPESASVRVALRIRPLSAEERCQGGQVCVYKDPAGPSVQFVASGSRPAVFTFDHVFDATSSQAHVFDTAVVPLIDNFFEGYNATVFAYGQVRTCGQCAPEGPTY